MVFLALDYGISREHFLIYQRVNVKTRRNPIKLQIIPLHGNQFFIVSMHPLTFFHL